MFNQALRHYWYPVATSTEVADKPHALQVLDERVVLYRAGERVVALRDLCIHRGAALSLGWIDGEHLVCRYHGWTYGPDGACVRIPSLDPERGIPRKACATAFKAEERYGLVWVCLDEPHATVPELKELEDPSYRSLFLGEQIWNTSVARMTENFFDISHFAWVHPGLLGSPDHPRIPDFPVERRGDEILFEVELPVPHEGVYQGGVSRYSFRIVKPFVTQFWRLLPEGKRATTIGVAGPISATQARRYTFHSRNSDLERSDEHYINYARTVMEQDRVVVESQHPEELPLDLREELHLKGPDAASLEYRRMLAELGLV